MKGGFNRITAFGHHHRCQNLFEPGHRYGYRQDPASLTIHTDNAARISCKGGADLGVIGRTGNRRINIQRKRLVTFKQGQQTVGQIAHDFGEKVVVARGGKFFGLNGPGPKRLDIATIGNQVAIHRKKARACARDTDQTTHHFARHFKLNAVGGIIPGTDRRRRKRSGIHFRLNRHGFQFGMDQFLLITAKIQNPGNKHEQRQRIHSQNAPCQRGKQPMTFFYTCCARFVLDRCLVVIVGGKVAHSNPQIQPGRIKIRPEKRGVSPLLWLCHDTDIPHRTRFRFP